MGSQDWEQFGEEIRRTVQDAVDSRDFASLNQTITNTINQALNSAARTIDRTAQNVDRFVNYGQNAGRYRDRGPNADGYGAYGPNADGYGNYGSNANADGYGNYGSNANADGYGNYGSNANADGYGTYGSNAEGYGNYGSNAEGYGKNGSNAEGYGNYGTNADGYGNYGSNADGYGNYGTNAGGYGNYGSNADTYGKRGSTPGGFGDSGMGSQNGGGMNGRYSSAYWREAAKRTQNYRASQKKNPLYEPGTAAKAGGIILAILGYGVGGALLLGLISVFAYYGLSAQSFGSLGFQVSSSILGALTAGCAAMAVAGTSKLKKIGRFRSYVRELNGREFCNIKELADKQKKAPKFIVKDLEKMIKKGWFRQGHLDSQKTCLMVTNEAYNQYLQLEQQMEQKKREEELRREKEQSEAAERKEKNSEARLSPEVQKIIEQGDLYVEKIRKCNDAIPGKEISDKISHMEMLVDRIFDRVEQNPESVTDIHRLMDYYLPTTIKLLEAYEDLDAQPVGGENIQKSKKEIEATLDTLNMAFEKLLDDLFQDTAWDLSSDISVLHTMLAQEGLMEDDFKK